ncbi:hypothetical protein [Chelativorans xinjiangense]|uniref:hypothetical protein n=1 Tax=Chelativorans xinjiangense TaxID=2681485 RepID=UPI001915EA5E|nr:hypothetical protein [Chelativorans xinjiangense]
MIRLSLLLGCMIAGSCAGTNVIQTSENTAIVQASAAPICGGIGAARVAQKQAAIATLQAGFDRYVIMGSSAANNTRVSQGPGTYQTTGIYGGGMMNATTVYQPGPVIHSGSHDQAFAVRMFREGEPGAAQAISARNALGPEWEKAVESGSLATCL